MKRQRVLGRSNSSCMCGTLWQSLSDQTWTVCLRSHWYWTLIWSVIFIPLFNSINRNKTRFFLDGYLLWKFSFSCFCLVFSFVFELFILKRLPTFIFLALFESWLWCLQFVWWNLWITCGFGEIRIRKYVKCTSWLASKNRHYWGQEGRWIADTDV